ncbi:hypothetical protein PENTCL1PPCAC_21982, partial [Pristionchus entomophagus]
CRKATKKRLEDEVCLKNCAKTEMSPAGCHRVSYEIGKKRSAEEQPLTYIIRQQEGKRCRAECKDSEQKDACERDCEATI